MLYGICPLSIIPARAEPSDKSEQVTQLLFGEHFRMLKKKGGWLYIQTAYDDYKCWIESKQVLEIPEEEYLYLSSHPYLRSSALIGEAVRRRDGMQITLLLGSVLPHFNDCVFRIGADEFKYTGEFESKGNPTATDVITAAKKYLDAPYHWGGRSPFGIDCSGLTQMAYSLCGIKLPRDSHIQMNCGKTVESPDEASEADLAFFSGLNTDSKKITHVGLVLVNRRIIHSSGRVRIDTLDEKGIYDEEKKIYLCKLREIKRIL